MGRALSHKCNASEGKGEGRSQRPKALQAFSPSQASCSCPWRVFAHDARLLLTVRLRLGAPLGLRTATTGTYQPLLRVRINCEALWTTDTPTVPSVHACLLYSGHVPTRIRRADVRLRRHHHRKLLEPPADENLDARAPWFFSRSAGFAALRGIAKSFSLSKGRLAGDDLASVCREVHTSSTLQLTSATLHVLLMSTSLRAVRQAQALGKTLAAVAACRSRARYVMVQKTSSTYLGCLGGCHLLHVLLEQALLSLLHRCTHTCKPRRACRLLLHTAWQHASILLLGRAVPSSLT